MLSISPVERISILSRLILKYCDNLRLIEAVQLAKELATILDELRKYNINLAKLESEFTRFFPEHWEKRTKFLLITTKYWPEILNNLGKEDVKLNNNFIYKYKCICNNLSNHLDITSIKNPISIFKAPDIYEEINYITNIVKNNPKKTISIVSPDATFSEILYRKLDIEDIEFFSSFENFDRNKIKPFLNTLEGMSAELSEFLDEISKNFGSFGEILPKDFKKLIVLLLDFFVQEKEKKRVSIIKIDDIKYSTDDIIIATSMNEESWKFKEKGDYWLHDSLRRRIGLPGSHIGRQSIEDNFYSIFNGISELFFTRSLSANGASCSQSHILSKFELMCKKNNMNLNYHNFEKKFRTPPEKATSNINQSAFILPPELSAKNIELLMQDPEGFYAREVLGITPLCTDTSYLDFAIFFKNLLHSHFKNDSQVDHWLDLIRTVDFFSYQKCKTIIEWLNGQNIQFKKSYNNIKGAIDLNINNFNYKIFSYADRIEQDNNSSTLITYQSTSAEATSDIIYGSKSSIMTTCLIAKKGGFPEIRKPINKIQIWSISSQGNTIPFNIKTLEINEELIDNFEVRLITILKKYSEIQADIFLNPDSRLDKRYNKYKHFERK